MTALVVTNSSCLKLSRTAIKADKQKTTRWIGYKSILPETANGGLKTKKAQPTAAQEISPPSENIWFLLRKTKEKIARMGDNSDFSQILVEFYNEARTHFQEKCWAGNARPARKTILCIFWVLPPPNFFFEFGKSLVGRFDHAVSVI